MKKELFIQPHSDDIILSCFSRLMNAENPTILTIEHDNKRSLEDEKLKEVFPNLEIINGIELIDPSYKEYWGGNMHRKFNPEEIMETFINSNEEGAILEIDELIDKILGKGFDEVYTCMGVGHPLHWFVHELTKDEATEFYQDWPHSYKKRNNGFFQSYSNEFEFVGEDSDEDMLELKHDLFKRYYKTQSGLLYFEQKNIEKNFSEKYYKL